MVGDYRRAIEYHLRHKQIAQELQDRYGRRTSHERSFFALQWFLTFITYIALVSNTIARFTPDTLSDAHLLKIRMEKTLTV